MNSGQTPVREVDLKETRDRDKWPDKRREECNEERGGGELADG